MPAATQVTDLGKPLHFSVDHDGRPTHAVGKDGEKLTVTLLRMVDPACAVGGSSLLFRGQKYVALELRLTNDGNTPFDDSASNCTWGWTNTRQQAGSYVYPTITAGPLIDRSAQNLPPGHTTTGYIVMAIPIGAHLTRVEFTPDSGFAEVTGEWQIKS
nr:hypothetical protein [Streptomyces sp. 846.5]